MTVLIFGMSIYQLLWYFLIYSFLGWVAEVVFHAVVLGIIVNRGFLNGPVCPIYGFGVISVFALAYFSGGGEQMLDTLPIWELFLGGSLLATSVELLGGFVLDMCFHARWWDYSDKPFNLHGYICLEFSLIWGFCIAFVLRVMHPYLRACSVEFIPESIGTVILTVAYLTYLTDVVVTVLMVNRLNRSLKELDEIQKRLRIVSNGLTDAIGSSAYKTKNTLETGKEKATTASKHLKESVASANVRIESGIRNVRKGLENAVDSGRERLDQKRREMLGAIMKERYFGMGRLLRAHPGMKHRDYQELVSALQEKLNSAKK